jgi:hypothetical protein
VYFSKTFPENLGLRRVADTLREDLCIFVVISRSVILRTRIVSDKIVEKIKARVLCSVDFSERRTVYETVYKNMVEPDRPQMTI